MTEANEQYAYFAMTGDFDPAEITARVGVIPTTCWRRGDLHPRTHRERQFSRWTLHSRLYRNSELEDQIRDVLAQLEQNPQAFATVSQEFAGVMQLVAYWRANYPGLQFDRALTDGLSRFALAVDFDFYWLGTDRPDDDDL